MTIRQCLRISRCDRGVILRGDDPPKTTLLGSEDRDPEREHRRLSEKVGLDRAEPDRSVNRLLPIKIDQEVTLLGFRENSEVVIEKSLQQRKGCSRRDRLRQQLDVGKTDRSVIPANR